MKPILLCIAILIMGCAEKSVTKAEEGYVIQGKLTNIKDSTLLLLHDLNTAKNIDSTFVVGNTFTLKGKVDEPRHYVLQTKFDPDNPSGFTYLFFWINNSNIQIKGDFEDFQYATVSGSKLHELAQKLSLGQMDLEKRRKTIVDSIQSGKGDRESLIAEMHQIDSTRNAWTMQFIRAEPNNRVSLNQLTYLKDQFSKQDLDQIYASLDEELKQSTDGITLKNYLSIDKVLEKGDAISSVVGENLDGQKVDLSEVIKNNEYTILDFWAAGCGPCRMQSKQYVELYEKYKDKGLEIVSFSLDKNRTYWENASEEDQIVWVNISDLKGPNGKIPMSYGVKGIPNSFLIDKNGVIVDELLGFDTDKAPFTEMLTTLFEPGL
jgi:thiol-disulfide isomerase/thioredoxin